ncbi:PREDICTED: uncharacterized protein LOC108691087 [Atta colombica]|uniref:uncharacterized protein LOC108691087 n=1 Tax=Atta colombica TaxID=520822 RepID=UPI00084C43E6|nr:PREDICTED: uncharacterized protein LOC108691087 [Atta colombica]
MRNYTNISAWQMDEISMQPHNYDTQDTMEENICKRHFLDNVSQNSQETHVVSKWVILFEVTKLYLLGQVIVIAKLILQDLWQLAIQWDESVPQDIHTHWIPFRTQMSDLNQLRIPRCVKLNAHQPIVEVHGFCDASQHGLHIHSRQARYHSKLLCSKSRVASLKTVSLPRLELSAALLLARLINKGKTQSEALIGSLPASRVNVSRPFSRCGVDYAGPLLLRERRRRNARSHKAGRPTHIYSENGITFVGAHRQIQELYDMYNDSQVQSEIKNFLCELEISWSFIPPNAPHFRGLWETVVKSKIKYHITRIVSKVSHLTFEEMQTTLYEIEAILNSRPLLPLSADPNDLAYLSSGHFLVSTPLNGLPCVDLSDVNENRLLRWQRVEQIRQYFWRRWSNEYLHSLQARTK